MSKIIFCFLPILLFGCWDSDYDERSIESRLCIVDSVEIRYSVNQSYNNIAYVYHTDCGVRVLESKTQRFFVGDTIRLAYLKYRKKTIYDQEKN